MVQLLKGGQPYKMSKRAGNVILMSDITAEIGSDALRFIFLTLYQIYFYDRLYLLLDML